MKTNIIVFTINKIKRLYKYYILLLTTYLLEIIYILGIICKFFFFYRGIKWLFNKLVTIIFIYVVYYFICAFVSTYMVYWCAIKID